jgi:outer membrane protein
MLIPCLSSCKSAFQGRHQAQMRIRRRAFLAILFIAAPWAAAVGQQEVPLTLRQAVTLSLEKNPGRQISQADVDSMEVNSHLARTALLPNLFFGESVTRGNDPVYVFGSLLRQQNFQAKNFSLDSLNRPTPINNFVTRFSGNWMAFDSWHTQFEIHRADLLAKSTAASAAQSDEEIIHRVVQAYQSILFAIRQAELTEHSVETAKALLGSSESRVIAGLAVDSDKLAASANLAELQQEQIAANGRVEVAWAELEAAIGQAIPAPQRQLQPLTERTFDSAPLAESVSLAIKTRPDRQSLGLAKEAGETAVKSAKSAFGPQISAFGSWETDRPSIGGEGGNNWIAGAELRLDILPVGKRDNLAAARIAHRRVQAATASADQQIQLEVTRAYYEHQAASKMLDASRSVIAQTEESLRILRDRYDAGLITITEALRAEDADRQSRLNYWHAVFQNTLTYANLRFATGTLTPDSVEDLQ